MNHQGSPSYPSLKVTLLSVLTSVLALPFQVVKPFSSVFWRVYFLTAAKIKNPHFQGSIQFDGKINLVGTGNVSIGQRSRIGGDVEFGTEENGQIIIGNDVRINRGTTLVAYESISIGEKTLIGEFVSIRDANHGISSGQFIREQAHDVSGIRIGKDVWIGRGSVLLPGVVIGDHSIIGANSVVTKSIPPGFIAVGSPAKVIRKRS